VVEAPEREGGPPTEPELDRSSRGRMAASCVVGAGIGMAVPLTQHLHIKGPMAGVLFWTWFVGPVVAGAVLQRRGFLPYLAPVTAWYGVLLLAMESGWMAPVSAEHASDFDPTAAVVYLVGALPFVVTLAAAASFVAGNMALRLRSILGRPGS